MSKKKGFRASLCVTMVLVFLLSFSSTIAFADTKTVTAVRSYDIVAPIEVVSNIQSSISNSTYSYDDGSYKGTLSFTSFSNWNQTFLYMQDSLHMYHFTFDANYSGTVTSYPLATKQVTVVKSYSYVAPLQVADNIKQSILNGTINYDDGSYKGTLNCTGISNWQQTFYGMSGTLPLYTFTFDATYSGTVTQY